MTGAPAPDLRPVLRKLVARAELTEREVSATLDAILVGSASESVIASFLVALAMKGESPAEIRAIL